MSEKVIRLVPNGVGEGYRFEADEILEKAKGKGFTLVAVLGKLPDGTVWVSASGNLGETMVLMEMAKHTVLFPDR